MKDQIKRRLSAWGVVVHRLSAEEQAFRRGFDPAGAPDPASAEYLQLTNPRLRELQQLYQTLGKHRESPNASASTWASADRSTLHDLQYFRGESLFLWQYTDSLPLSRLRTFVTHRYVADRDGRGLLGLLDEDGAFGCLTTQFSGSQLLSRDLLDSVNELGFLGRHTALFDEVNFSVIDVGAGYGRSAHRTLTACPNVGVYYCIDAVARSTFLCEYYLAYRGIASRASVLALDAVVAESNLMPGSIDLAVNVHSFSEMPRHSIGVWLRWLSGLDVPQIFVVPNERDLILSREPDGRRIDCTDIFRDAGYRLQASEPVFDDAGVRDVLGVEDVFLLFSR